MRVVALIVLLVIASLSLAEDCTRCHRGYSMSPPHDSCVSCHGTHKSLIENPGDLDASKVCGGCHKREVEVIKDSPMALARKMINYTRYQWGAQGSTELKYSVKNMPYSELVDDFLRKRCLFCHLYAETPYRARGCGACHMKEGHRLTLPDVWSCISCHHFNRAGQGYVGLFEHDYHEVYISPYIGGKPVKPDYDGVIYHRLVPDIHYEKGMSCTDCHGNVMFGIKSVTCTSCHRKPGDELHSIKGHKALKCYACHSVWSPQDYGLHVIREDDPDWFKWEPLLHQGYPWMMELYEKESSYMRDIITGEMRKGVWFLGWTMRRWETPPLGKDEKGMVGILRPSYYYYVSYIKENGKVVLDSYTPRKGFMVDEYFPHTTRKGGRWCEDCHGNPKALGLGFGILSLNGTFTPIIEYPELNLTRYGGFEGARHLSEIEIHSLLDVNGDSYKKERYKIFRIYGR